jgi:cell division protein ZapA
MWNKFLNLSKRLTEPTNVKEGSIMKAKVVKVNILGQDYVVRSTAGQKYLEQVAKYVDDKMEEIKASGIDDSQQLRIAILASMNITDELFAYKKEKKKFVDKVEAKTIAITEFIENRIQDIEESKK